MTRLQCPRCERTIQPPASGDPVCPHCGFSAPYEDQEAATQQGAPGPAEPQPFGGPSPGSMPPPGPAEPSLYGGSYYSQSYPAQGAHAAGAVTRTSGMAVTSLILGLIAACLIFVAWMPIFGWMALAPAVLAAIFGGVGVSQCNQDASLSGKGMAVAGLVLGIIVGAFTLLFRLMWAAVLPGL